MIKLSEQELESFRKLVSDFNETKMKLADTVMAQSSLMKEVDELKKVYSTEEALLIEKYGKDSVINIQTGEVKNSEYVEKEKENGKD
jgi:hypothetical protein